MAFFPNLPLQPHVPQGAGVDLGYGTAWAYNSVTSQAGPAPDGSLDEVSRMRARIAALEAELAQAVADKAAMQAANEALLQCLASSLKAGEASGSRLTKDKVRLKVRLAAVRQENGRLRAKARTAMMARLASSSTRAQARPDSSTTASLIDEPVSCPSQASYPQFCPRCAPQLPMEGDILKTIIDAPVPELPSLVPSQPTPIAEDPRSTAADDQGSATLDIYLLDQFLLPLEATSPSMIQTKHTKGYDSVHANAAMPPKGKEPERRSNASQGVRSDENAKVKLQSIPTDTEAAHQKARGIDEDGKAAMAGPSTTLARLPLRPKNTTVRCNDSQRPKWSATGSAFESSSEQAESMRLQGFLLKKSDPRSLPEFFHFGIRFSPENENGYRRTVLLTNLGPETTFSALLAVVRGGMVVSSVIADTRPLTSTKSALVVFLDDRAAAAYASFVQLHQVEVAGRRIQARRLSTPTWPISQALGSQIKKSRFTRCLELSNLPASYEPQTVRDLVCGNRVTVMDELEHMDVDVDSLLQLRFSSIAAAVRAFDSLRAIHALRGSAIEPGPDPCAGPLQEIVR